MLKSLNLNIKSHGLFAQTNNKLILTLGAPGPIGICLAPNPMLLKRVEVVNPNLKFVVVAMVKSLLWTHSEIQVSKTGTFVLKRLLKNQLSKRQFSRKIRLSLNPFFCGTVNKL